MYKSVPHLLLVMMLTFLLAGSHIARAQHILPRPDSGYYSKARVEFAFDDVSQVELHGRDFSSSQKWEYSDIEDLLAQFGATDIARLFAEHSAKVLNELRSKGEARVHHNLPNLNNWYSCVLPSEEAARKLAEQLAQNQHIRSASAVGVPILLAADIPPTTPLYESYQSYMNAAPTGVGISTAWAEENGDGNGISICHVEGGWYLDHEDFDLVYLGGGNMSDTNWRDHGTACVSILAAVQNAYGITGLAHGVDEISCSGIDNGSASAWIRASNHLEEGDIIAASWGYGGSLPSGYNCSCNPLQAGSQPAESNQADFEAIQTITANGRIVVNSAANGCVPMDNVYYNSIYDLGYRDSGAIIVGAADVDRDPACFTNYGSRIDAYAQGEYVYSAGYGDLFSGGGDTRQYYTSDFGGTSGACPIVAGALATLQAIYKSRYDGAVLDAWQMRTLLRNTGTPQASASGSKPISNMPNMEELIDAISGGAPDTTPPVIQHTPLSNQAGNGPWPVSAQVSDISGIACATLFWRSNGGLWGSVLMSAIGSSYSAVIPAQADGSVVEYYITATDGSPEANSATSTVWSFTVLTATSGIVLLTPSESTYSDGDAWESALADAGYNGVIQNVNDLDGVALGAETDALIVLLGIYSRNFVVEENSSTAAAITTFMQEGGLVYMEGGDCWAYDPNHGGYEFCTMFGVTGNSDGTGDLSTVVGQPPASGNHSYSGANAWIDRLGSSGATLLFSNEEAGYNCGYYQNGDIRSVAVSFELAGLSDFDEIVAALFGDELFGVLSPDPCENDSEAPCITHTPLSDTSDTLGPYDVIADLYDNCALDDVSLEYRVDGNEWSVVDFEPDDNTWAGSIPGQSAGGLIEYRITASDHNANETQQAWSFTVFYTPAPPHFSFEPAQINAEVDAGASVTAQLMLQNTGEQTLTWDAFVSQNTLCGESREQPFEPLALAKDQRDPRTPAFAGRSSIADGGGYLWRDSNEPDGPTVSFIDISVSGTALALEDDANSGPLELGFPFHYYGDTYTRVNVCSNGWVSFTATSNEYANQQIPTPDELNALIAPMWDDFNPASGGDVYYESRSECFIVQWDEVPRFNEDGAYTFELILHRDGRVEFQYAELSTTLDSATIGIESADGSCGTQIAFNTDYLCSNMAIVLEHNDEDPWLSVSQNSGSLAQGEQDTLLLTMNATTMSGGVFSGQLSIVTNEPGRIQTYVIPVLLDVSSPDSDPPVILLDCLGDTFIPDSRDVTVLVSDASSLEIVSLHWSSEGSGDTIIMYHNGDHQYSAVLPVIAAGQMLSYFVEACDNWGNTDSSEVCSYEVRQLTAPGLTLSIVDSEELELRWSEVEGALFYRLYCAGADGVWYELATSCEPCCLISPHEDEVCSFKVTAVAE